ncbi:unnamed protein product [Arabidopsis arenosa]|uniref:Uncharacterized protein n=1 Tax=Arabidopsis arenosa TaxID=38785 RepID=A0A8S2AE96_ARAAE|nr:unnamed protein product [Arabidopsis arenosa]
MDCKKEETLRRGPWLEEEDERLVKFITLLGERRWDSLAIVSGLKRSGKSCRLRWSKIARRLPGRTDNEIKNYWRTHSRKKEEAQNYDKVIEWRGNTGEELLHKYKETEITRARNTSQGHGFDEVVKEFNQRSMESGKETNCGICGRESYGFMNSPYENRISDWISEISPDQSEANLSEDHSSSSSENNINIGTWWFQETRDFEEFSCSLWS